MKPKDNNMKTKDNNAVQSRSIQSNPIPMLQAALDGTLFPEANDVATPEADPADDCASSAPGKTALAGLAAA